MGNIRMEGKGKTYGQTKYCPFNSNGNACSKSCALYDASREPFCWMCPGEVSTEVTLRSEPADYSSIVKAIEDMTLQLMEMSEKTSVSKGQEKTASVTPVVDENKLIDGFLNQVTPFELCNKQTGDVFESFTCYCRRKGTPTTMAQRGLTERVIKLTGLGLNEKGHTKFYESTPQFIKWASARMAK